MDARPQGVDGLAQSTSDAGAVGTAAPVVLRGHNGVQPYDVRPIPVFHGRQVPMRAGFVDVEQIQLWDDNERLTIHVNQFRKLRGRDPGPDDLAWNKPITH